MDYAELARQTRANLERKPAKAPRVSTGIDPRAWISEIGGTIGGIAGGALTGGTPMGAAAGAAAGSSLGKILEQKVKGEAIKPMDVATEAGLSALFAYGPVRAAKGVLGMGTKAAAQPTVAGAVKGEFTKKQREAIDLLGKAWGVHPGMSLPGKGAIGVTKANQYQTFLKKLGVPKTAAALDVMDIADSAKKATANVISQNLKGTTKTFSKQTLTTDLRKAFEKVLGAGQIPTSTILLPTDTAAQRAAKLAISKGTKSAVKVNTFIDDIYKTLSKGGVSHEDLWNLRKLIDKQMINFSKGTDKASGVAQEIGQAARNEISKILKTDKVLASQFNNYNTLSEIYDLISPVVKAPKGTYVPGLGRVGGKTTQRLQALGGSLLGGGGTGEAAVKAAPSLLQTARGQVGRQAAAAGLRTAVTPPQPSPEGFAPIAVPTTGMEATAPGMAPVAPAQIDPRLYRIAAAVEQDIARTGGKNIKNIQTIAGLYGIDLSPLGLQPATAAKTGFAALTADQQKRVANLNTVSAALNNLEQSVAQSGFFPQEPQALSTLLGPGRQAIGGAINPEQRQYMASLRSRGIQIIRALGEVGNLSASEQEAAIKVLPKPGDNARTAALKIAQLRALFSDVAQRVASPQIGTFQ